MENDFSEETSKQIELGESKKTILVQNQNTNNGKYISE